MTPHDANLPPLFMPISSAPTSANRTGSWSSRQPRYEGKTAPCSVHCPCGEDIPHIEMLAARGEYTEAWRTILAENPLPGSCGRVCFHPCEGGCNRGEFDDPVAINALERFLDDRAGCGPLPADFLPLSTSGKRIAIAGSGPAGLAAAWFLARLGHECEIFESAPEPGGLLRYGIPAYRLPAAVLDREIGRITELGVRIRCSTPLEKELLANAASQYDALFIGCGNSRGIGLDLPGGEYALDGLSFLRAVRSGSALSGGDKYRLHDDPQGAAAPRTAAIIGGGNTAIDVARTLLRLGITPTILYRRRREEMPAFSHEIDSALAEGVHLIELSAPLAIRPAGKNLALTLQKMRITEPGADGRMRVLPVEGESREMTFSAVYAAIGARAEEPWHSLARAEGGLNFGHTLLLPVGAAGLPVLLGGDLVNQVESVADAIASGKEAAIALDLLFREGSAAIAAGIERCRIGGGHSLSMEIYQGGPRRSRSRRVVAFQDINRDYFTSSRPQRGGSLPHTTAAGSFAEVEAALEAGQALEQAGRCFNCGICNDCDNCRTFCPEAAVVLDGQNSGGSDRERRITYDYCKGCGVCLTECPRCAMVMEEMGS